MVDSNQTQTNQSNEKPVEVKPTESVETTKPVKAPETPSVSKTNGKTIKVQATRQVNFGKLDPNGVIVHFLEEEVKELPLDEYHEETIMRAIEDGMLKQI